MTNSNIVKILITLMIFLLISMGIHAAEPSPTPVGKVVWVKGTLTATMPNKEVRTLQKDSVIYLRDTLETNDNSQAQIVFTDNTLMTLDKNTKFVVENYDYDPKKSKKSVGQSVMSLVKGGFRTITGVIAKKNHDDYTVKTPVATIGVRGTDYAVHLEKDDLYIAQYDGTPCVHNEKGLLCLDVNHRYAKISKGQAPQYLTEEPVHFKEKLTIIAIKFGLFNTKTRVIYVKEKGSFQGTSKKNDNSFCIQ